MSRQLAQPYRSALLGAVQEAPDRNRCISTFSFGTPRSFIARHIGRGALRYVAAAQFQIRQPSPAD
jgi:hypothetical protein